MDLPTRTKQRFQRLSAKKP